MGSTLTYSIDGDDAAHFSIDDFANPSFINAPDFEASQDGGYTTGDNVYELTVQVAGGIHTDTQNISVEAQDEIETAVPTIVQIINDVSVPNVATFFGKAGSGTQVARWENLTSFPLVASPSGIASRRRRQRSCAPNQGCHWR